MTKQKILKSVTFGQRVAEDETDELATYFVETDQWERLFRGEIDVVYGAKGSGKSALYSLLNSKSHELKNRKILLASGENPRGTPAFRDLVTSPPASEREFVGLWKLYFLSLLHNILVNNGINSNEVKQLEKALAREKLIKGSRSLSGILHAVVDYARRALRPQAVETGVEIDPNTQLPIGFTGKIIFSEPSGSSGDTELISVDHLLFLANTALEQKGFNVWILLDRLDVAFAESHDLEKNALRALFRVYLDLQTMSKINLKIFLRTDIWRRITSEGFREASHITRHLTINWNRNSLLNLIIRRALHNKSIRSFYDIRTDLSKQEVVAQEKFFYRMCPDQVDVGLKKLNTLDWLLTRTKDGTTGAPRELVHLLNCLRDVQVRHLELGDVEPDGQLLFDRPSFKEALPEVSTVRLEQTLYAEYPAQKEWLEKLRGAKTLHTSETLSDIWGISREEANMRANELAGIGFFEARGDRKSPDYWVPFLYRDALDMIQGTAD